MRRLDQEDGATALIVTLLVVVLLGLSALVLDVGNLFWERRQLQNAADAAALAVAMDCAAGDCGDAQATATDIAVQNDARGANVEDVDIDMGMWEVAVITRTGDESGSESVIENWLIPILDESLSESVVRARAVASWLPSGLGSLLPVALSTCDFMSEDPDPDNPYTVAQLEAKAESLPSTDEVEWSLANGGAWPPPGGSTNDAPEFRQIIMHDPDDDDGCTFSPGFAGDGESVMPAGFGWLYTEDASCNLDFQMHEAGDGSFWVPQREGASGGAQSGHCIEVGEAPDVPVFIEFWHKTEDPPPAPHPGFTNKHQYRLYAPSGFYITGMRAPPVNVGTTSCTGATWCIEGYFVKKVGGDGDGEIDTGVYRPYLRE